MPTGYTAAVQSGEITTLQEYAMQCARAFGALITMRDEPSGAPIPDAFKPVKQAERSLTYHTDERAKEVKRAEDRTKWVADLRESLISS